MKITMSLDSKARILAGLEPCHSATLEIDPADVPQHLRQYLTLTPTLDSQDYPLPGCSGGYMGTSLVVPLPLEATTESATQYLQDYHDALTAWQAERDAQRAERAAVVRGQLGIVRARIAEHEAAGTLHTLTVRNPDRDPLGSYIGDTECLDSAEMDEYTQLRSRAEEGASREASVLFLADFAARVDYRQKYLGWSLTPEAEAEAKLRKDGDRAASERVADAAADRKQAQLADAIARLGDESQRARWAENLLPTREAVDLIVAEALEPVRSAGIEILSDVSPDIEHSEECHEGDDDPNIDTDETVMTKLARNTYAALTRVRAAVPQGATIEAVKVTAKCEQCEARASRTYIRATWTVGEIEVAINVAV